MTANMVFLSMGKTTVENEKKKTTQTNTNIVNRNKALPKNNSRDRIKNTAERRTKKNVSVTVTVVVIMVVVIVGCWCLVMS